MLTQNAVRRPHNYRAQPALWDMGQAQREAVIGVSAENTQMWSGPVQGRHATKLTVYLKFALSSILLTSQIFKDAVLPSSHTGAWSSNFYES